LSNLLKDGVNRGTTLVGACCPALPPPHALMHGRWRVPITVDSTGRPFSAATQGWVRRWPAGRAHTALDSLDARRGAY